MQRNFAGPNVDESPCGHDAAGILLPNTGGALFRLPSCSRLRHIWTSELFLSRLAEATAECFLEHDFGLSCNQSYSLAEEKCDADLHEEWQLNPEQGGLDSLQETRKTGLKDYSIATHVSEDLGYISELTGLNRIVDNSCTSNQTHDRNHEYTSREVNALNFGLRGIASPCDDVTSSVNFDPSIVKEAIEQNFSSPCTSQIPARDTVAELGFMLYPTRNVGNPQIGYLQSQQSVPAMQVSPNDKILPLFTQADVIVSSSALATEVVLHPESQAESFSFGVFPSGIPMEVEPHVRQQPQYIQHLQYLPVPDEAKAMIHCATCGKSFVGVQMLSEHLAKAHPYLSKEPTAKKHKCGVCGQSFTAKCNLSKHIRSVHERRRPYSCSLCPSAFAEKSKRDKHYNAVHSRIRPFSCTHCPTRFGQLSDLRRHMAVVVQGERPYSCEVCQRAFGRRSSLGQHMQRVHDAPIRPLRAKHQGANAVNLVQAVPAAFQPGHAAGINSEPDRCIS
jgi:Zinc finger, C2H2 type